MDHAAALQYLDDHMDRGVIPGLARIKGLLDLMGNPETGYPVIHVTGTNGKTSVSRMATALLLAHGLTTGTFTSPHLERVEERFEVNGFALSEDDLAQAITDLAAFADIFEERIGETLTYFELTAATAFSWFAHQAVNAAVIEVGLGGRLDATNVVDAEVAVLTSVGMDHTEYLGSTLEAIAGEKLAIVAEGATLITGALPPDLERQARREVARQGGIAHVFGKDFGLEGAVPALGGWNIDVEGTRAVYQDIYLPVHGRHQTMNFAVAVAAVESLLGRELSHEAVVDAGAVVSAPGRMEVVSGEPTVLMDGAHNPAGFEVLGRALQEEFPATRWILVLAAMSDKDIEGMVPGVSNSIDSVITTTVPDTPRAMRAEELARRVTPLVSVDVGAIDDPAQAVDVAAAIATERENTGVLVAGSIYLLGHLRGRWSSSPG